MKKILLTPGPTNVPDDIAFETTKDLIHHRMPEFLSLVGDVSTKLQKVFLTNERVITLTSSGTGALEASIVNLFSKDDEVLLINIGFFGNHYKLGAEAFGLKVHELKYAYGESYDIKDVEDFIIKNPNIKGILVVHNETSTGVLNNLEQLGNLTRDTNILLCVDSISGLIFNEVEFDKWGIDSLVTASQKGFLMAPGVSFIVLSKKAQKAMETSNLPKRYFDLKLYMDGLESKNMFPFTPAIALFFALNKSLDKILNKGLENIRKEKVELRTHFMKELEKLGFENFVKNESNISNSMLVVTNKNLTRMNDFLEDMKKDGIYIAGGIQDLENKIARVGLLGDITIEMVDEIIIKMKKRLERFK